MIEVKNLVKKFGESKAIDDLSFSINSGEIVGFLGPNGAGKTTTMRILSGFFSSDKGKVIIDGINIEENPEKAQKKIGYLPENNPLYGNMQVGEFLSLAADLSGVSSKRKKEALRKAARAVGIEKVYWKPIAELSKGFRQRVGLAAALIHDPKIVIMDEPTEGLDPNQRNDIRALIRDLAKNHTVLMSTHVMQEAQAICSRLLIINEGKLVAQGTPEELSRSMEKGIFFEVVIEGENVLEKIRQIEGVKEIVLKNQQAKKTDLKIIAREDHEIRPALSRLVAENHWIIWKLEEEKFRLEEIFEALTKK